MLAPFFHVGVIVPELGEAQRALGSTLGLTWASQQRREMPVQINGETVHRDISFVYSLEGPPYVELIGANEPPWNLRGGMHHLGMWSSDIVADIDAMVADSYSVAATGLNRKGYSGGFAYLNSPTGLLVELVDIRGKDAFDRWLAGGDYT